MTILFIAAIIPIIALCAFVYYKDRNKEPKGLLALIFFLGILSVIPILICELVFEFFIPMDTKAGLPILFLEVFFGIAFFEEIFKWLITKFVGYNNREFDEVYDVIVYAVFASLGFACFENVLYVFNNGLGNAVLRGLLAVPGHTCFGISMGFFLSRAKVAQLNGNKSVYSKNIFLSMLVPMVLHTLYDTLLFAVADVTDLGSLAVGMIPFIIFYVFMVITCFITVDKTAKVQQRLVNSLNEGTIYRNDQGYLAYNFENPTPIVQSGAVPATTAPVVSDAVPTTSAPVTSPLVSDLYKEDVQQPTFHFCPVCGKPTNGGNFCSRCGFKLK